MIGHWDTVRPLGYWVVHLALAGTLQLGAHTYALYYISI